MDFSEKEMTCIKVRTASYALGFYIQRNTLHFPWHISKKKKEPTSRENTSHYSFSAPSLKVLKSISVRVLASLRNFFYNITFKKNPG